MIDALPVYVDSTFQEILFNLRNYEKAIKLIKNVHL